jgi:hypothetical protein
MVTRERRQLFLLTAVRTQLFGRLNPAKAILHAYDATNLSNELFNSNQASGGRDSLGSNVKFAPPTVVSGKVFVGTQKALVVYGLLP